MINNNYNFFACYSIISGHPLPIIVNTSVNPIQRISKVYYYYLFYTTRYTIVN